MHPHALHPDGILTARGRGTLGPADASDTSLVRRRTADVSVQASRFVVDGERHVPPAPSIGVKRIRLNGSERVWHPACADRYCAAMPAGTPEDIVATTRRAGASFDLSEDGSGFVPNLTRMSDRAASNAILDAIAANREAILDLLRRELGR